MSGQRMTGLEMIPQHDEESLLNRLTMNEWTNNAPCIQAIKIGLSRCCTSALTSDIGLCL